MKTRFLIAAIFTVLLAGCTTAEEWEAFFSSTSPEQQIRSAECAALQQAEQQNAKDLEAYCFTEQTQSSLKCEQAKSKKPDLKVIRDRLAETPLICRQLQF